jgi:hypothetical protein
MATRSKRTIPKKTPLKKKRAIKNPTKRSVQKESKKLHAKKPIQKIKKSPIRAKKKHTFQITKPKPLQVKIKRPVQTKPTEPIYKYKPRPVVPIIPIAQPTVLSNEINLQPIFLKVALPKEICNYSSEFTPDLNCLPPWESRHSLKNLIFAKNLKFYCLNRASADFQVTMALLAKSPNQDISGHFVICMKSNNQIVGALDAYLVDDTIILDSSYVRTDKKREFQLLLYAAALTKHDIKYVVCSAKVTKITPDFVGLLNLLGRGFGMYAIPFAGSRIVFVRRMNKEGPLSTGPEIAHILRSLRIFVDDSIKSAVFEFNRKGGVSLIQLPMSQNTRENMLELRDTISLLGFSVSSLDHLIPLLEQLSHKDLTPEMLF